MSHTIRDLPVANSVSSNSLFVVEIDPDGNHSTQSVNVATLFANVTVNTFFSNAAFATATGNNVTIDSLFIANTYTPNGSADNITGRKIWFDADYLYVTTSNNVTKRVALQSF